MGQCPAYSYIDPILNLINSGKFDVVDIIPHKLSIDKGEYVYKIFDGKDDKCIKVILKPQSYI
ncbi:hypothetical protein [Clostridium sp.]|uniref:hypothetical protein n=1 Tax=Clostridium sp. TaxID=1506 RepID=UPI0034642EB9